MGSSRLWRSATKATIRKADVLSLPAELTHDVAKDCLAQLVSKLDTEASPVVVSATDLERFDSSALAVLLELRRTCLRADKTLVVQSLPKHLSDLATLYGIEGLLPAS
jgi:phospholipid transport system transporter-binding protein